ncbi:MAG: DNA primase [Anaerolineae bacterium]|nr:DNA primase [Anaerolineae bacterium]
MSVTEEIKARLDIVNVVSQYVQLKKAGRNYKAPCPFHAERTPSFVVFPDSGTWRCFGACGEGGDIFNFVMKKEGLDFASALKFLAEKAGVELHERSPEQVSQDERLDKLRGLLQETATFFHDKLSQPEGRSALAYAHKRGLSDDTLNQFVVGYAPDGWRNALDHLLLIGYNEDEVIEAGVAIRNEAGRVYDRFRNRLVIPICDNRGQVIGFGARALNPDDNPKYLNSPQTPLFDKSATLFGLHLARRSIRESETAVIVEGYMDAIQAHQGGFSNVVAQMGTALTDPQLRQLSKYARRLILALDPDVAGVKATMRGLEVARQTLGDSELVFDPRGMMRQASKLDMEILVITLPDGQDPDDLIRDKPEAWQALIDSAQSVTDYVINAGTARLTAQTSFSEREQIAHQLLPILLATENDLQQHYNVQRLALKLHLDERTLIQWAQQQQRRLPPKPNGQQPEPKKADRPAAWPVAPAKRLGNASEAYCLAMLIRDPKLLRVANRKLRELAGEVEAAREALSSLGAEDFTRSDYQQIFRTFEQALAQDDFDTVEYLQQHLPYELYMEVIRLLVEPLDVFKQGLLPSMHAQFEAELEAARKKKEWITPSTGQDEPDFVNRMLDLRKQRLKRENNDLYFLLQDASPDTEMEYNRKLIVNKYALKVLDQTVKTRLQREQG